MKTRFDISHEIFVDNSMEESLEIYENEYRKQGFELDTETESVFLDSWKEFNLNEGDRVKLYGIWVVKWKTVDIENDMIIYELESE